VAVPAAFNKTWLEQKLAGKVLGALHTIDYAGLHTEPVARVELCRRGGRMSAPCMRGACYHSPARRA